MCNSTGTFLVTNCKKWELISAISSLSVTYLFSWMLALLTEKSPHLFFYKKKNETKKLKELYFNSLWTWHTKSHKDNVCTWGDGDGGGGGNGWDYRRRPLEMLIPNWQEVGRQPTRTADLEGWLWIRTADRIQEMVCEDSWQDANDVWRELTGWRKWHMNV